MFKKNTIIVTIFSILLLTFTIYILADTFLITRVYSQIEYETTNETASALSDSEEDSSYDESGTEGSDPVITETSYQDDNIQITLEEYETNDTTVYVADIQLSDASYLQTALAQGLYGKNVTAETSETAESVGAILAINGDYYGSQERGYVLRNGVLYRETADSGQEDLVIYADGSFGIINESEISAEELLENGAVQILSFGPALVENGSISVSVNDEGGSSTMYFNGQLVNNPTTSGNSIKEREVSDIVYIGY